MPSLDNPTEPFFELCNILVIWIFPDFGCILGMTTLRHAECRRCWADELGLFMVTVP